MEPLNFPVFQFTLRQQEGKTYVLDPARRQYVRLTPEEWVRQHVIRYLMEFLNYPLSHMAVEKKLTIHQLTRRADLLVYDQHLNPSLLIECKAPDVPLTNSTFRQVSAYNIRFKVPWLMITNGKQHFAAYIHHHEKRIVWVDQVPEYGNLNKQPVNNTKKQNTDKPGGL